MAPSSGRRSLSSTPTTAPHFSEIAVQFRSLTEPAGAWTAHAAALGLHVADEAANGFLSFYNPLAARLKDAATFLPVPVFRFDVWLGGLAAGIIVLLLLTPLARRGSEGLRYVALGLAALMTLNGAAHLSVSVAIGEVVPGTYTSPLLVAAAVNLALVARRRWHRSSGKYPPVR